MPPGNYAGRFFIFMTNIIERTKDILFKKAKAIDCNSARMLAITGKTCSSDDRMAEFVEEINASIENKARCGRFMLLVQIPKDLVDNSDIIKDNLISRGFSIHTFKPEINDSFLISWKF